MTAENQIEEPLTGADASIQRLYDYLDGALSHQDIEDVRLHLEQCPECAAAYSLECVIRSAMRRSCTERAPEQLKVRIMSRISVIRSESGHRGH